MIQYDEFSLCSQEICVVKKKIYNLGQIKHFKVEKKEITGVTKSMYSIYTVTNSDGIKYKIWDRSLSKIFSRALETEKKLSIIPLSNPKLKGRLFTSNNTISGLSFVKDKEYIAEGYFFMIEVDGFIFE